MTEVKGIGNDGVNLYRKIILNTEEAKTPAYSCFKICQITTILCLTCGLFYAYKCIIDLKTELGNLKSDLVEKNCGEKLLKELIGEKVSVEDLWMDNTFDDEKLIRTKKKREIASSNENASRPSSSELAKMASSRSASEESAELLLNFSNRPTTTKKPHRNHRKHKKYGRYMVSAEKFFTQLESTTSTPIQIRRSRTKQTDSNESGKYIHRAERKPLLQAYASKESITREEAMQRSLLAQNLPPESFPQIVSKSKTELGNGTYVDFAISNEIADTVTYNMIMVHFAADTSHYSREKDAHYFGNGRMQTKTSIYKDWKPAHWTQNMEVSKYFLLNQGKVTVSVTGIYLIYAQIQYSNVQEVNGYAVVRNKQAIVQCITTSVHPDKEEIKSNTCDTSTTILLHANDKIHIQDLHHGRHVVLTPEKSYFGLILLSPFKGNKLYP